MKLQYIFSMEEYFLLFYGFGELFKLLSSNELFLYMDIASFFFFFFWSHRLLREEQGNRGIE